MLSIFQHRLPDYYPTMFLDGYSPEEILFSAKKTLLKKVAEDRQAEEAEAVQEIHITSEIHTK